MATEKPRFTITVSDELLNKIDDFRYDNRFPTRTEAVVELLTCALDKLEKKSEEKEKN